MRNEKKNWKFIEAKSIADDDDDGNGNGFGCKT